MPNEVPNSLVYQRVRNRRIEWLDLLTDGNAQIEYQRKVPYVSVSNELINRWDDYMHPGHDVENSLPYGLYTFEERAALCSFNRVFLEVCESSPQTLPEISEFQETEEWRKLQAAAAETFAVFQSRGMLSEDVLDMVRQTHHCAYLPWRFGGSTSPTLTPASPRRPH